MEHISLLERLTRSLGGSGDLFAAARRCRLDIPLASAYLAADRTVPQDLVELVNEQRLRNEVYESLLQQLQEAAPEIRPQKGLALQKLLPDHLVRRSADLDLHALSQSAFWRTSQELHDLGWEAGAISLVQCDDGQIGVTRAFWRDHVAGYPKRLRVELADFLACGSQRFLAVRGDMLPDGERLVVEICEELFQEHSAKLGRRAFDLAVVLAAHPATDRLSATLAATANRRHFDRLAGFLKQAGEQRHTLGGKPNAWATERSLPKGGFTRVVHWAHCDLAPRPRRDLLRSPVRSDLIDGTKAVVRAVTRRSALHLHLPDLLRIGAWTFGQWVDPESSDEPHFDVWSGHDVYVTPGGTFALGFRSYDFAQWRPL